MKRKARKGEFVCRCGAYKFPHRFTGGRCSGYYLVSEYWDTHWGSGACKTCNSCNEGSCDVFDGREVVGECEAFQEFIRVNEIVVYQNRR